ncbi:helix-turn-helix domain-containing protein [Streptomyces sp. AK02-01A]|uniref:TetR/AcrR family transcriptional regulator n=1 Tax=Streptomyces sp. AK02-01A TaxID=3028648 RepID=UPI0029B627AD|nr:helix-turn-helix domain-containing protein [Streptomyces sp. AK02-01A]MDX3855189.1 helix-turn-helix domain containing protein [Streptomyces sp. AK02-01A]
MRQDARRNRERVLAAAREVYAEQGVEAPLDVIARRAGVGNATLYRRFPDRAALIEAVFHDVLAATIEAGERARAAADAWAGLNGYLERIFEGLAADRGATDLMTTGIAGVPTLETLHAHNAETVRGLLERCREDGTVRADLTVEDLLFTLAALGRAVPAAEAVAPGSWRRFLALLLDGLRAGGTRTLPAGPLTPEELARTLGELHAARRPPAAEQRGHTAPSG